MNTTPDRRRLYCFRKINSPSRPPPTQIEIPHHTDLLPTRCDTHPLLEARLSGPNCESRPNSAILNACKHCIAVSMTSSFVTVPNHAQDGMTLLTQNEVRNSNSDDINSPDTLYIPYVTFKNSTHCQQSVPVATRSKA